jgi:hypothetical protein
MRIKQFHAHHSEALHLFSGAYKTGSFVRSRQGLASRRRGKQMTLHLRNGK